MQRALELARQGLFTTHPNPRVGCVLVKDDKIIAEGWHEKAGAAHAEINALKKAGENAKGATCYVTLEPCCHQGRTGPCIQALIDAGVKQVIAAMRDPNPLVAGKGFAILSENGIEVEVGLLESEAQELNIGFIKRMQHGLPFVRAKLAMSLDGRIAMQSGESQWITGEAARADGQRLRARASAILTGSGTVLADDPKLNVRLPNFDRQPMRVIIDSQLQTPATAQILQQPGEVLIFTLNKDVATQQALRDAGAEIVLAKAQNNKVDLFDVLTVLAQRECNEIHVEAGSGLIGALLQANLIDELICYLAPKCLGSDAQAAFHLPGLAQLSDAVQLRFDSVERMGEDLRIRLVNGIY
tara:strand:- start:12421 stop:13488 length:1068 start_codon:yes stop_codon:yes gene_type:complete